MSDKLTVNQPGAPGETDSTVSQQSGLTYREAFTKPGGTAAGSANQMAVSIEATELPDDSKADSEKIGLYVNVEQANPSPADADGTEPVTRDAVAAELDAEAVVAGRAWASHMAVEADTLGSTTVGLEINSINRTGKVDPNPLHSGPDSHIDMRLMTDGNAPTTAAIVIGQGSQPFEEAIVIAPDAVVPGHDALDVLSGDIELGSSDNLVLDPGAAIVAKLANGRRVIVGYVNQDGWLVLGGPGIPNIVAWSENKKGYVPLTT